VRSSCFALFLLPCLILLFLPHVQSRLPSMLDSMPLQHGHADSPLIVPAAKACGVADNSTTEHRESGDGNVATLRNNVMQLFFKRLTSRDEDLVAGARSGLAAVVAHQKMPKALLQARIKFAGRSSYALCDAAHRLPGACVFLYLEYQQLDISTSSGSSLFRIWQSCLRVQPVLAKLAHRFVPHCLISVSVGPEQFPPLGAGEPAAGAGQSGVPLQAGPAGTARPGAPPLPPLHLVQCHPGCALRTSRCFET